MKITILLFFDNIWKKFKKAKILQQLHVGKNEKVIWQLMKHENLAFQQIILQNKDLIKTLSKFKKKKSSSKNVKNYKNNCLAK